MTSRQHGASHVPMEDREAVEATQYTSQEAHFFTPEAQREMKIHGFQVLENCFDETEQKTETTSPPYALIVLSGNVGHWLEPLWKGATIRICADGGANLVYEKLSTHVRDRVMPNAIIGNLQKITDEVCHFYRDQHSVKMIKDTEPSTTDMTKCCEYVKNMLTTGPFQGRVDSVICYGAFGGRLDMELGNLDTLLRMTDKMPVSRFMMLSEGNLAEYLTPGYHLIQFHPRLEGIGSHCGLFPLGAHVRACHTMGLKYNLDGETLAFGGLVSVSNQVCAQQARIRVTDGCIWTTECEPIWPSGHEKADRPKSRRLRSSQQREKVECTPESIREATHQVAQAYHA